MIKTESKEYLNSKFFTLWVNNEEKATVLTAKATSKLNVQLLPVAGSLNKVPFVTETEGSGSLTFYKIIDDTLNKDINSCIKEGKPFEFDLIGEVENNSTGESERVIIEGCQITSFDLLNVDITSADALKQSFEFTYNPENSDIK